MILGWGEPSFPSFTALPEGTRPPTNALGTTPRGQPGGKGSKAGEGRAAAHEETPEGDGGPRLLVPTATGRPEMAYVSVTRREVCGRLNEIETKSDSATGEESPAGPGPGGCGRRLRLRTPRSIPSAARRSPRFRAPYRGERTYPRRPSVSAVPGGRPGAKLASVLGKVCRALKGSRRRARRSPEKYLQNRSRPSDSEERAPQSRRTQCPQPR